MKRDVISRYLSSCFQCIGETVALHPSYFVIIPVFTSLLLSTGLQNLKETNDVEFLVTPDGSRTLKERQRIKTLFTNQSGKDFFPGRETEAVPGGSLIITPSDGKTVFREAIFKKVLLVDELIRSLSVADRDVELKYEELCAKNDGECITNNNVLTLVDKLSDIVSGNHSIKYPISFTNHGQKFKYFGDSLGGVKLDEEGNVLSAQAIRLFYVLRADTDWRKTLAKKWEFGFLDAIESMEYKGIAVSGFSIVSEERELNKLLPQVLPLFPFAVVGMFLFSAITCLHEDWIQSKPWTGAIASTSALLALASGFGSMIYCGVTFAVTLAPIPFLILGVGMDDTYVLLAAWKRTDPKKSVAERMGQAYGESSMAITITSLTNFVAFISGVTTSFPAVRVFSLYASITVLFAYIYQITFVGAWMAICGHMEKQQRHSVTFLRVKSSEGKCETRPSSRKCFPIINLKVWQHLGNALTKWQVKASAMVLMISYLAVGFYGISKIKYTDDVRDSALHNSHFVRFIDQVYQYFYRYDLNVQIVIDQQLNYADPSVQFQIESFVSKVENSGYIAGSLTESWLRYYLNFLNNGRTAYIVQDYNVSDTKDFIEVLRNYFLRLPGAKRFQQDIAFNSDYSSIVSSRFICHTDVIKSQEDHYSALTLLRKLSSESSFTIFPYHFRNFALDEIDLLEEVTLQILSSVTAAIFVVCLLSVPDFLIAICVTCTVISIEISVLGYMALWDIAVSPIPMIIVSTCAGFAVDYAAHVSYSYSTSESHDPDQRVRNAVVRVGMPIFQGFATTGISLLPLLYPIANSLTVAFKIVFMVILFSFAHSLVFLPVMLSLIESLKKGLCNNRANINLTRNKSLTISGVVNMSFQENTV